MSKIFVTSDTHFNHTNICGPKLSKWDKGYRNFDSLEQMNALIIDNINAVVGPDDVLYHLGDFAFGDKLQIPALRARIACQNIRFVWGNHDEAIHKYNLYNLFESCDHYVELYYNHVLYTMFHFPIGSWHKIGRGSVNLFGHCHGSYDRVVGKQMDVGVDSNNFKPWALDDIAKLMKDREVALVDHHTKDTNYH